MSTTFDQVPTQGLSLKEAADHLGISESTLRRRIKSGKIRAFQSPTSQGFEWRVVVDSYSPDDGQVVTIDAHLPTNVDQVPTTVNTQLVNELEPLVELLAEERERVDRLQRENLELAGRLGFYQARVQQLEGEVLALKAPDPEPVKRSLWRRLFQLSPA